MKKTPPELVKGRKHKIYDGRTLHIVDEHLTTRPAEPKAPPEDAHKAHREAHAQARKQYEADLADSTASDIFVVDLEGNTPGAPISRANLEALLAKKAE